jgi:hypothetical protein
MDRLSTYIASDVVDKSTQIITSQDYYYSMIVARSKPSLPGHSFISYVKETKYTTSNYKNGVLQNKTYSWKPIDINSDLLLTSSAWQNIDIYVLGKLVKPRNDENRGIPTFNHSSDRADALSIINGNGFIPEGYKVRTKFISKEIYDRQIQLKPNDTGCTKYFVLGSIRASDNNCNCVTETVKLWNQTTGENFGGIFDPAVSVGTQASNLVPLSLLSVIEIYNLDTLNPLTGEQSSPSIIFERAYWNNR